MTADLEARVAALEARVEALERAEKQRWQPYKVGDLPFTPILGQPRPGGSLSAETGDDR